MRRAEGLAILTRCADARGVHWSGGLAWPIDECPTCRGTNDAGHLGTPGSRYGYNARECAPVAWRLAYILARDSGEPITEDTLDYTMGLVVNDHDDVARTIRDYGYRHYT